MPHIPHIVGPAVENGAVGKSAVHLVSIKDAHQLVAGHRAAGRVELGCTAVQVAGLAVHLADRSLPPRHVLHLQAEALNPAQQSNNGDITFSFSSPSCPSSAAVHSWLESTCRTSCLPHAADDAEWAMCPVWSEPARCWSVGQGQLQWL